MAMALQAPACGAGVRSSMATAMAPPNSRLACGSVARGCERLALPSSLSLSRPCASAAFRVQNPAALAAALKGLRRGKSLRPRLWRPASGVRVRAAVGANDGVRWWEKDGGPNFHDVHSTQEFVDALSNAGDKLVVVEFYASWCGSCRALYPKLCKLAAEHSDVEFLKVNFEENKPMCKSLNIRVLPFFHFYRGAEGRLEGFSCSLSKLQKLKDAIAQHNTERCSIGPPVGVGNIFSTTTNDHAGAATS